ncbi:MAG: hypothetical protein IGS03_14745 [Candidatus Sericytochromatia bacterium]|nr:hypothetical protein [Candidatus Sericytochromatia bacterium]
MVAIGDTVLYLTHETPEQSPLLTPAVLTGNREDGDVLLLQGAFYLGYVVSQLWTPDAPEPMQPGQYKEIEP